MTNRSNSAVIPLGLPNGSLQASAAWLINQLGITYDPSNRSAWQETGNLLVPRIFTSRPQHLVAALEDGTITAALLGADTLNEYAQGTEDIILLREFAISKTTLTDSTRVIIFVPDGSPCRSVADLAGQDILSECPAVTGRYLREQGIAAQVIFSTGNTESMIANGRYAAGVGVTETGTSLRANGLRILAEIMKAPVGLAVRTEQADDPSLLGLADMLAGIHAAQQYVLLKMNAPQAAVPAIISILPALKSPTIHRLYDTDLAAVETVIAKRELALLLVALRTAGASDFVWHDITGLSAINGRKEN